MDTSQPPGACANPRVPQDTIIMCLSTDNVTSVSESLGTCLNK